MRIVRSKTGVVVLVVIMAVMVISGVVSGGYDYNPAPKPAQDIIEALIPVPVATLDKFGHTERTKLIFNIVSLMEVAKNERLRVKALEGKVSGLEKRIIALETPAVIDPNEVSK